MDNTNLLEIVRQKAQQWLTPHYDDETRQAVRAMLDAADHTPLIEAFYKDLEFGTGGLRGIMGPGTNRMNRYTVAMATQGLANYLRKAFANEGRISVVIGHDCRHNSRFFSEVAASVFTANGIEVYLFDALRPTPEISFAIRHLGCQSGVMVTASHNPPMYNGYKAYWNDGAQLIAPHDVNVIAEVNKIASIADVAMTPRQELWHEIGPEIDREFIDAVAALSLAPEAIAKHRDMPIIYTPIHGTGMRIVPRALRAFGFNNIINVPQQDIISGDFPTVESPNPEEPAALNMAIERANETGADLVLASDPDGDRIGVAVRNKQGEMHLLNGNQICMLLTYYSIVRREERGELTEKDYVVKTIVTTELIAAIAKRHRVKLHDCYTGFKWIAAIIREQEGIGRYIGGGEESYGYLWEDFIRDKSSVSACCLFSEMTAWAKEKGLTIDELLTNIYLTYGLYADRGLNLVRQGREGAQEIADMMTRYRAEGIQHLAGSPVVEVLDYSTLIRRDLRTGKETPIEQPATSNVLQYIAEDGTKLSIRPSGTEPKIKYYIGVREPLSTATDEAATRGRAEHRIDEIVAAVVK